MWLCAGPANFSVFVVAIFCGFLLRFQRKSRKCLLKIEPVLPYDPGATGLRGQ